MGTLRIVICVCFLGGSQLLGLSASCFAQPVNAVASAEDSEDASANVTSPQAPAVDTQTPQQLFVKAQGAYAEGRHEEALQLLQQAFELDASPQLLYNIAQAQRQLGRCAAARESYVRYLQLEPDAERRALALVGLDRLQRCIPAIASVQADATSSTSANKVAEPMKTTPSFAVDTLERGSTDHAGGAGVAPAVWISWIATGALATGALTSGIVAFSIRLENRTSQSERRSTAEAKAAESKGHNWALAADILAAVALAAAGLSLYLTLEDPAPSSVGTTELGLGPGRVTFVHHF